MHKAYWVDGNHRRAIPPDRALLAQTTRQRQPYESARNQCHPVRGRARLQMARAAQALRQLAHRLHPHEPLVQKRGARSGVRGVAACSDRAHQDRGGGSGQYHRQSASGWYRGAKKNGPQSIGKSRGGWSTKIHMVAADARTAITFALSPGEAHDAPEGREAAALVGPSAVANPSAHGSCVRGRGNPATGAGPELHSRGSAQEQSSQWLGIRSRDVQATQRDRTTVPATEGIPAHFLAI